MIYTVRGEKEGTLQFGEAQQGERKNFGGDGWINGRGWGWMEGYFVDRSKAGSWKWMVDGGVTGVEDGVCVYFGREH